MQPVQLTFQKEGICAYISHLDIVRAFARALSRAGLPVKYSEGFNPIAYLVFSQPLSLGYESLCDICEFSLTKDVPYEEIRARLNATLPKGLFVVGCAAPTHAIGKIAYASYRLEIDTFIPIDDNALHNLQNVFAQPTLLIQKKSKRAEREVDIKPLIQSIAFAKSGPQSFQITCTLANSSKESLNPDYLMRIIERDLPPIEVSYVKTIRETFFLDDMTKF